MVASQNRFKMNNPCPICGGGENSPRHKGERCFGYLSEDKEWAYCTRIESTYPRKGNNEAYSHKLQGRCACGRSHGPEPIKAPIIPIQAKSSNADSRRKEAEYLYRLPNGNGAYKIVRYRYPNGEKDYKPYSWVEAENRWKLGQHVPVLLYHLPEILSAAPETPIYIVEGEKCADALAAVGLIATTNTYGAKKWHLTEDRHAPLRGRRVVILPDNDEAGRNHANQVAQDLGSIAATIQIVPLPGVKEHGDIADWLDSSGTRDALEALVQATPIWSSDGQQTNQSPMTATQQYDENDQESDGSPKRYRLLTVSDLFNQPRASWLIHGLLPDRSLAFMIGDYGSGKSFLAVDWMLSLATGRPWGSRRTKAGPVVYIAGEGKDGILKRVVAWCKYHRVSLADIAQFHMLDEAVPFMSTPGLAELVRVLEDMPEPPRLIVVDTLARAMTGGDENSAKDTSIVIEAMDSIKKRFHCTVLVLAHKNKTGTARGSTAIPGAADTIIDVVKDGELVSLSCTKQKNFRHFPDFNLHMQMVKLESDELPPLADGEEEYDEEDYGSCVLIPTSALSEEILPESQIKALQTLQLFPDGATAKTWLDAAKIPDSTFYLAVSELEKRGYVSGRSGRNKIYLVTSRGHQLIADRSAKASRNIQDLTQLISQKSDQQSSGKDNTVIPAVTPMNSNRGPIESVGVTPMNSNGTPMGHPRDGSWGGVGNPDNNNKLLSGSQLPPLHHHGADGPGKDFSSTATQTTSPSLSCASDKKQAHNQQWRSVMQSPCSRCGGDYKRDRETGVIVCSACGYSPQIRKVEQ